MQVIVIEGAVLELFFDLTAAPFRKLRPLPGSQSGSFERNAEQCRSRRATEANQAAVRVVTRVAHALPMLAAIEGLIAPNPTFAVTTQIEIQASPEIVWQTVIAFPEITDPPAWFFRSGIAAPLRARIEGSGVGAIRYCEFTTGTFVEPITVWDENKRLAFDVTEQPEPMFELTPYRHIHPPHLDGAFRSTRGEFRLEPLTNGGTRLTGTTWYVLEMHPQTYWTLWSDELVHQIHLRVLNHIQKIAEPGTTFTQGLRIVFCGSEDFEEVVGIEGADHAFALSAAF